MAQKIGQLAYTLARQLLVKDKGGIASLPSPKQILGKVQDIFQMLKAGGFNPVSADKSIKNVNDLKRVLTDIEMKQQVEFNLAKNRSEGLETVLEKMDKGIPLNPGDQAKVEGVEKLADDKVLDAFKGFKPKVIQGGKKKGIEQLLKSGDVKRGVAPKTTKETIERKSMIDPKLTEEENIKNIMAENKASAKRLEQKMNPEKDLGDRLKDYDGDPDAMAQGGRIGFSGGGAGFAGNQMEHDDGIGSFGPGPTFKEPTIDTMPQPQLNPMMFNMPMMQRPMPQGIIGLKDGGPPNPGRRNFMKMMAGLASLPFVGKLFKGAKVAEKVVQLKNTTTTMPAWFPKFVDKFISKGVGRKVDQDLMQYETKDLPGVKLEVKSDGKIRVEGQNAYNEPYLIDYEPPGYEVLDYSTGKAVKTKGEFAAADTQYFRTGDPREMDYDVDYNTVKDLDDLLGGNSTRLEGFAKGTNKEKYTKGQRAVDEADSRADVYEGPDIDMSDYEDFAKGGLAYMLGE